MKRILIPLPMLLLVPWGLQAQIILQIAPATPLPTSVVPGQSFSFNLQLVNTTDPDIVEFDYELQSVTSGIQTPVSGIFVLQSLTIPNGAALSSPNSSLTLPTALSPQVGSSSQPTDLGAATPTSFPNAGLSQGTSTLETLTLSVNSNAVPGSYQLEFYQVPGLGPVDIYDNTSFSSVDSATEPLFSSTIDISATPEPSTWEMMLVGSGILLLFRRFLQIGCISEIKHYSEINRSGIDRFCAKTGSN